MNGLFQGIEHEPGIRYAAHAPAHDAVGEGIDDKRNVDEALPRRHLGEVADPEHVQRRRLELAVHLVQRTGLGLVRDHRPGFFATNDALDPNILHQPGNGTACNIKAFTAHLMPDLANAVDLVVLLPNAFDLGLQGTIPLRPIRQQVGVRPLGHVIVERGRGNRQVLADRLDTDVPVLFDKGDHVLDRRSSSA